MITCSSQNEVIFLINLNVRKSDFYMRKCRQLCGNLSLSLMNSFNKTKNAIFPMQTMLPYDYPFSQIYFRKFWARLKRFKHYLNARHRIPLTCSSPACPTGTNKRINDFPVKFLLIGLKCWAICRCHICSISSVVSFLKPFPLTFHLLYYIRGVGRQGVLQQNI